MKPVSVGPDVTNVFARLQAALAGRYAIERELGRGGMATVYLARDLRHERFLREIQIAAQLAHPHILPLHDSGAAGAFLTTSCPMSRASPCAIA